MRMKYAAAAIIGLFMVIVALVFMAVYSARPKFEMPKPDAEARQTAPKPVPPLIPPNLDAPADEPKTPKEEEKKDPRQEEIDLAAKVWRVGETAIPRDSYRGIAREGRDTISGVTFVEFEGIDEFTRQFMDDPKTQPAVQHSDAKRSTPYERGLEEALKKNDPIIRLQALVVLMKVRAPRSVALQRKTLSDLMSTEMGKDVRTLLAALDASFSTNSLLKTLQRDEPAEDAEDREYCWAIRAAGVTRQARLLPRVCALSLSQNLSTCLAAELSLEDFDGEKAERALAACAFGPSDAFIKAGHALLKRNKRMLHKNMVDFKISDGHEWGQGALLAECNDPRAVPILCEALNQDQAWSPWSKSLQFMFDHIARLATEDHKDLMEELPSKVKPEFKESAVAAVKKYQDRMAAEKKFTIK
jgi:hypothetical protein